MGEGGFGAQGMYSEMEDRETVVEWYVRDANGRVHGPWSEKACREDVASGEGGVEVLRRYVTKLEVVKQ